MSLFQRVPTAAPIRFQRPVTLVGAGDAGRRAVDLARRVAPDVVAADGGADKLRAWRLGLRAVVGDMDSVADLHYWRARGAVVRHVSDQNQTDLEKCLREVDAPLYVAVGFLGDRLDHSFAAFGLLLRWRRPIVLVGRADIAFAAPRRWIAQLDAGTRVSILAGSRIRASGSEGLRWPLKDLEFAPGDTIGVANIASSGLVRIDFDQRGGILVLPRAAISAACQSLLREPPPA